MDVNNFVVGTFEVWDTKIKLYVKDCCSFVDFENSVGSVSTEFFSFVDATNCFADLCKSVMNK